MAANTAEVPAHTEPNQSRDHVAAISEPQHHEQPTFDLNNEQEIKATLTLAQQVVSDRKASRSPREISKDEAIKMAVLVSDMLRMLNANMIARDSIARAAAYMRGESHLTAGHALRQARNDRRYRQGYGQQYYSNNNNGNAQDVTEALNGVNINDTTNTSTADPKTEPSVPQTTTASTTIAVNKENIDPVSEEQPKESNMSSRKSKRKAYWNNRRNRARKTDGAEMDGNADAVVAVDGADKSKDAETHNNPSTDKQVLEKATGEAGDAVDGDAAKISTVTDKAEADATAHVQAASSITATVETKHAEPKDNKKDNSSTTVNSEPKTEDSAVAKKEDAQDGVAATG